MKKRIKKRSQITRGFTMIELMVTIAVSSVVMVAVTLVLGAIMRQWNGQVSRGRTIQIANLAMSQISREVRSAVLFQAVDGTKTCTFTFPANTNASGNYVPAWYRTYLRYASGSRVHYYLSDLTGVASSGPVLWRETNPLSSGDTGWVQDSAWSLSPGSLAGSALTSSARGRMDNISALTFTTDVTKPNTVQASITVSYQEGKITSAYTLTRTLYLGNHN